MLNHVRDRRALRAGGVLLCALWIAGCGDAGGADGPNPNPSQQHALDAAVAAGDGGGLLPDEPRMGPGGAVAVRNQPDPDCIRAIHDSGRYWLCSTPQRASTAMATCWAAGGTLVVIEDADENEFLRSQLIEPFYFIGYSDADVEDEWKWVGGVSGDFENWADGEPGVPDFAVIERDSGEWFASTNEERPYICEDWK
jgi:hypothetical protein